MTTVEILYSVKKISSSLYSSSLDDDDDDDDNIINISSNIDDVDDDDDDLKIEFVFVCSFIRVCLLLLLNNLESKIVFFFIGKISEEFRFSYMDRFCFVYRSFCFSIQDLLN